MDRQIKEQPTEGRLNALCESESGGTHERDVPDTDSKRGCRWNTKWQDTKMLGNCEEVRSQGTGTLNPMWVEWLMGFPIGWTDLED